MCIRIGLIDSGININYPPITQKDCIINGWKGVYNDFNDSLGHGTQCAHLILKTAEFIPEIYNIKVFDKTLKTSTKNILDALQWCIENDIQLINLSLSIPDINYYYEFKHICDEAFEKGIIIVSSADNIGRPCLPAYLNNVFGVGTAGIENDFDFYCTDSTIQLYAKGVAPNLNISMSATSFATARITGRIATVMQQHSGMNFNQLKNELLSKSLPFNKEKILIKNEKIDLGKYTIPVLLNKYDDVELCVEELKSISTRHITNNQKTNMALINLTNEIEIVDIELKLKDELAKRNHKILQMSSSAKAKALGFDYSFSCYKQIPKELCSAYAKALIETVNNQHSDTELIIIGMGKPVVPSYTNSLNFFDNYTSSEISLLFGFQIDTCILVVNELTEFRYIQRNVDSIRGLFNADVMFVIYSSLSYSAEKNNTAQYIPNFEQVKKISISQFIKLQNEINDKLNIDIYDINDEDHSKNIYDKILDALN
jgi:hypothetical protein